MHRDTRHVRKVLKWLTLLTVLVAILNTITAPVYVGIALIALTVGYSVGRVHQTYIVRAGIMRVVRQSLFAEAERKGMINLKAETIYPNPGAENGGTNTR
jgi:hypothetical protein